VIILNSSPVIHLSAALCGLELLPRLYGRVLVPREVHQELEAGAHLDAAGARLRAVAGIEIITLAGGTSPLLTGELDIGEAAVIQLAIDLPGATVVLGGGEALAKPGAERRQDAGPLTQVLPASKKILWYVPYSPWFVIRQ
jgi:predicted nucleic acid-binding protein